MTYKCPHCKAEIDKVDIKADVSITKGSTKIASCPKCKTIINVF